MIAKTTPLALLLATFTALASFGCDAEPGDEFDRVDVDSAVLSLDDGGELLFLSDDDGEVTIIGVNGAAGHGHLAALDEGVTPAELWVSLSGAGADVDATELPEFLLDHHEASVDREVEVEVDLDLILPTARSLEYPESWGSALFSAPAHALSPSTVTVTASPIGGMDSSHTEIETSGAVDLENDYGSTIYYQFSSTGSWSSGNATALANGQSASSTVDASGYILFGTVPAGPSLTNTRITKTGG